MGEHVNTQPSKESVEIAEVMFLTFGAPVKSILEIRNNTSKLKKGDKPYRPIPNNFGKNKIVRINEVDYVRVNPENKKPYRDNDGKRSMVNSAQTKERLKRLLARKYSVMQQEER